MTVDIGTSAGLALSSGINAYFPLLSFALYAHFMNPRSLNPQFAFMTQGWFIALLIILTLADVFADKIPGVDHIWDAIHTVIRPVAGALVTLVSQSHTTGIEVPLLLVGGAVLAGMTHTTKATVRVASTTCTAGFLNIFLSIGEDVLMVIGSLLALFAPYVMLVVVIVAVIVFLLSLRRIIKLFNRRKQRKANMQAPLKI